VADPSAVLRPGNILELFSLDSPHTIPVVDILIVIEDPGPDIYIMDERLVERMQPII
jgi:hypothetical protein